MNDITLNPGTDDAPIILVDLNSMLNAALLGGKDSDAVITIVDGKPVSTNSARYGVDRMVARLTEVLGDLGATPRNVVGVWDGRGAKAVRQAILPQYKASLKAEPVHEQLNLARPMVSQLLHDVGAHTVDCESCEADDVIGYMTHRLRTRRTIVVTGDGDLSVLVDDNTSVLKLDNSGKGKGDKLNENPFGPFPHKYITVYKALVGDTSDKIPGAKGFGDAAFVKLVARWGVEGLAEMERLIKTGRLQELEEDVPDLPALRKVIDDADNVYASWKCASLMPQRVNALRFPLNWRPGFAKLWSELAPSDRVEAWKPWYATQTLVHAGNYERVLASLRPALYDTPFTALDIETSVPEESLAWMEQTRSRGAKGVTVDVQGSTLTGFSMCFGDNSQHTIYVAVDHSEEDGVKNVTSDQARWLVELTPQATQTVVWNRSFELQVLYRAWGAAWKDNGWSGFLPNCIDGLVEASYVDEGQPLGLKHRSLHNLGYTQESYEHVTTVDGVQKQMCELAATHVLSYGADDARVTAALHTWQRIVMELEHTWEVFLEVETLPEYATSLGTIQGIPVDLGRLSKMEAEDRVTMQEAERALDAYLTSKGWDGTVLPVYDELTPATVKEAVALSLGPVGIDDSGDSVDFSTRKRKLDAIAEDILQAYPDNEDASILAAAVAQGSARLVNEVVARNFSGRPKFNVGSPKQVQRFLYDTIGATPRVFNKLTDGQRNDQEFRDAFYAKRDFDNGTLGREPTDYERSVWMMKASTDDAAVEFALSADNLPEEEKVTLRAFLKLKELRTRFSLFYASWLTYPHWTDGRLHPEFHQCRAVTRRHSSSAPNLQQATAHGEGAKIREALVAPDEWIHWSLDLSSQELLHQAEWSQDEAMLSCFDPAAPKDIHSLVAVQAAPFLWGRSITYDEFQAMRKSDDPEVASRAADLRLMAKRVVFGSAYGMAAPKLAIMLQTDEATAQKFLDAKEAAFPGLNPWKAGVEGEAEITGVAHTRLGVPRHLRQALLSPNSWVRSKAARQASNYCIQSGSGEQLRLALSSVWRSGVLRGKYRAQLIGPIHDELTGMVHRDDAVPVIRAVHAAMTQPYADFTTPIRSSLAIGLTFATPVEVGTDFTDEELAEAVSALFT